MKRIISFLFVVLIVLSSLLIPVSATELPTDIRTSAVLDDLSKMDIEGRQFNEKNYPENVYGTDYVRVLSFLEYGYDSKGDQSDYGLYIYIYNPKLKSFALEGNKIQIAVGETEETIGIVRKYPLVEVSRSPDYRFIKYRVSNFQPGGANAPIYDLVKRDERIYQVSGIELKMYGSNANAKEYEIGGTYIYTGFMKGHGFDPGASSTLYCNAEDLLTIELDIRGATWRSETSSVGLGHKNEIASVYFGIDQSILDNYGYLYRVEGEFYENKIGSIVTDSQELYDVYKNLVGTKVEDLDGYDAAKKYSLNYPFLQSKNYSFANNPSTNIGEAVYSFGLNCTDHSSPVLITKYDYISSLVPYFYIVSKFALEGDIDVTWKEHLANVQKQGLYPLQPTKHHEYKIELGDKLHLESYNRGNHSLWEYFIESGGNAFWHAPNDENFNVPMLEPFDTKDLSKGDSSLSASLYMAEDYISDFRSYTASQSLQNKKVHILRFACNDYYSVDAIANNYTDGVQNLSAEASCYYAEQTYYDDFDILRLTFMDEYGNETPFLVSSSPTDVVGGLENTSDYDTDETVNAVLDFLKKLFGFILVALLIVGVFWLIDKIFAWINGASISATLKKSLQSKSSPTKKRKRK